MFLFSKLAVLPALSFHCFYQLPCVFSPEYTSHLNFLFSTFHGNHVLTQSQDCKHHCTYRGTSHGFPVSWTTTPTSDHWLPRRNLIHNRITHLRRPSRPICFAHKGGCSRQVLLNLNLGKNPRHLRLILTFMINGSVLYDLVNTMNHVYKS